MVNTFRHVTIAAVVVLAAAACGGGDGEPEATTETSPAIEDTGAPTAAGSGMGMGGMGFGQPAEASEADRTIEVNVDNDLAFEPDHFEVSPGEVVTFRISNTGDVEHEFVLGDEQAQAMMAEQMEDGGDHGHSGEMMNAVTIHSDDTRELTWRFSEPGTVLVGCHVPGHWEAGMRGEVVVTG